MLNHPSQNSLEEQLVNLDHLINSCDQCGLCLEGCVTYQMTGWEHESPRGRIQIAKEFLNGKIQPDDAHLETFDRCIACQACEPLCPQQVKYSKIYKLIQLLRRELAQKPFTEKDKQWFKKIKRQTSVYWKCAIVLRMLFNLNSFQLQNGQKKLNPYLPILAVCCQQDLYNHHYLRKTLDFFKKIDVPVQINRYQPCCGAKVAGVNQEAVYALQQKRRREFAVFKTSQTYFLSSGCQQFSQTPGLYQWLEKILENKRLAMKDRTKRFYYQPFCSIDLKEKQAIERLFKRIEHLNIEALPFRTCCGGWKCGVNEISECYLAGNYLPLITKGSCLLVTSEECFQQWKKIEEIQVMYVIELLDQCLI